MDGRSGIEVRDMKLYPAVPKTNLSISNPSSERQFEKFCVRLPAVTVNVGQANVRDVDPFQTCVPAERRQ